MRNGPSCKAYFKTVFLTLIFTFLAFSAFAKELQEDNLLVAEVYIDKTNIHSILEVFEQDNVLYLPLLETLSLLGMELKYALDPHLLQNQLKEQDVIYAEGDIASYQGNTYVAAPVLQNLIGGLISFDNFTQQLKLKSAGKKFPLEEKWEREDREEAFDARQAYADTLGGEVIRGTDKFQLPFVDFSGGYFYRKDKGGPTASFWGSSLHAFGITGSWDSELYYYDMSNYIPSSLTLKTSKYSEEGNILGIFKQAQIGDIYTTTSPASDGILNGYGFSFSTYADDAIYEKQLNIRDVLPSGWEVELYRNGELLGYQRNTLSGYYEFQNITLYPGENKFVLIFYGPQGQVRKQERVLYYGGNLLNKGELGIRTYAVNKNKTITGRGVDYGSAFTGLSALFSAAYGITQNITADAAIVQEPVTFYGAQDVRKENKTFASGGLSFMVHPLYFNMETLYDFKEGAASLDANIVSSLGGFSFNLDNQYFGETLTSKNVRNDRILKNMASAEVRKTLDIFGAFEMPFTFSYQNLIDKDNITQDDFYFTVYKVLWANIYTGVGYKNSDSFNNYRQEFLTFYLSKIFGRHSFRMDGEYNLNYDKISYVSGTLQLYVAKNMDTNIRYNRRADDISKSKYTDIYSGGLNFKTKIGYFNIDAGYYSSKSTYVSAGYSLSFGYDIKNKEFLHTPDKLYNTGMVAASSYKDKNNNNIFDKEDEQLDSKPFTIKPDVYGDRVFYSANNYKYFPNLRRYYPYQVSLNVNDVEDGFSLLDQNKRKLVMVRPGEIVHIEYPLKDSAFIDGTAYFSDAKSGKHAPFSGIRLNLVDVKNKTVVASTVSEYDGYYSFDKVPLGIYRVLPDYKALHLLKYDFEECQSVNLTMPEKVYQCPYTLYKDKYAVQN